MELVISVNVSTSWAIAVNAIVFQALFLHTDDTLRDGITSAVGARMSLGLKAIPVGLHHIDALALGSASLTDFTAVAIISVDKVDTSNTARVLVGYVHVELEGAST